MAITDMFLIGFLFDYGKSFLRLCEKAAAPFAVALDHLYTKVGVTVNGGVYVPFILTVDRLGRLC